MKIAFTQRVDYLKERKEYRDSLDHALVKLILSIGHKPLLIPNILYDDSNKLFFHKWFVFFN